MPADDLAHRALDPLPVGRTEVAKKRRVIFVRERGKSNIVSLSTTMLQSVVRKTARRRRH